MRDRGFATWVALFMAFALVAAACGGDDDDDGGGAAAEPTEENAGDDGEPTASDDSGDDAGEPSDDDAASGDDGDGAGDDGATDADADEAAGDGGETVELTASARGVTAETITIGLTVIDFELLNEQFGLDLAFANFAPAYEAVVDWYNERGGVLGRQIDVVTELYLPVGATTADAACLILTEDNETFAVLGGFNGPGAEAVNDCIVGLNETPLVGPAPNAQQQADYGGLWVSAEMSLDRRNAAFVNLLAESGELDSLGPIMIIGGDANSEAIVSNMAQAFRDAGADVRLETVITTTGDTQATFAEVDVLVERARTDGIETIVLLGEAENRNIRIFDVAPEFTYLVPNGDRITDWQSIPPEGLQEGTRVLASTSDVLLGDDAAFDECAAEIGARLGVEVKETSTLEEGETNYWSGARNACQNVHMFVEVAKEAGPDLTVESWLAALDTVELTIPGFPFVSVSGTKTDASDTLRLASYDLATLTFEPLTETLDVG